MPTFRRLPGLIFIAAVNAVAAAVLFGMIPFLTDPDRAVAYLVFGLLHGWLAFGLYFGSSITRIVMIGAAVFHVAGFLINIVVTLMLTGETGFTTAIAARLVLSIGIVVFMTWAAFYLLNGLTKGWFTSVVGDVDNHADAREQE
ncbi:MAG: hypothetical protein WDZ63_09010 [Burkholderiales bacterium]